MKHKAGFVNIIGNPNVGRPTTANLGRSGISSIVFCSNTLTQTTRHRILGIVNGEDFQIIYSDLPGILSPNYKLQEKMMKFIHSALKDADVFLYMVEAGETKYNQSIVSTRKKSNPKLL